MSLWTSHRELRDSSCDSVSLPTNGRAHANGFETSEGQPNNSHLTISLLSVYGETENTTGLMQTEVSTLHADLDGGIGHDKGCGRVWVSSRSFQQYTQLQSLTGAPGRRRSCHTSLFRSENPRRMPRLSVIVVLIYVKCHAWPFTNAPQQ